MNQTYHWVHLPTGTRGSTLWSAQHEHLSDAQKFKFLNDWNRIGMIGQTIPNYHYWM